MGVIAKLAALLLIAATDVAVAAPNIPPSEMPGRERGRFRESPLDRFMDPLALPRNAEPLLRWECPKPIPWKKQRRARQKQDC